MKIEQNRWTETEGWEMGLPGELGKTSQLVLLFGGTSKLKEAKYFNEIKKAYPNTYLLGCSTAGEIYGTEVSDETLVATAVHFESSHFKAASICVNEVEDSVQAGVRDILGERTVMTGFYSYGELSPFTPNSECVLHNQTMTVTTISEH
ncbi:MAG: FIST N-terminal domain-containing protein [Waddliaceae bacterium]